MFATYVRRDDYVHCNCYKWWKSDRSSNYASSFVRGKRSFPPWMVESSARCERPLEGKFLPILTVVQISINIYIYIYIYIYDFSFFTNCCRLEIVSRFIYTVINFTKI